MERHERGVAHLGEVLDAVVERAARALRGPDGDPQAHASAERIEDAEESLGLVRRAVLVNRDVHVVVAEDSCNSEEGSEEIRDDVERVVEVDGEEVLVCLRLVILYDLVQTVAVR